MRLAHFSDLHLLDLEGVSPTRFLNKRLTGYANLRLKRNHIHKSAYVHAIAREIRRVGVDHVVVTGDLTNLALEGEFQLAKTVMEEHLGLDADHVTLVPGNHDLYTRGAMRGRRFHQYFGSYMKSDLPDHGVEAGGGRFPVVKIRGPIAIIGLSSAVPRLPFVAAGELGEKQLEALDGILAHEQVRTRACVFAVHHPVHNPRTWLKTRLEGLHDAKKLLSRVHKLGHAMLLHGHLHRRMHRTTDTDGGRFHAVGATSASLHHDETQRMAGFNLYEMTGEGHLLRVEAHVFDPSAHTFRIENVPKVP